MEDVVRDSLTGGENGKSCQLCHRQAARGTEGVKCPELEGERNRKRLGLLGRQADAEKEERYTKREGHCKRQHEKGGWKVGEVEPGG